MTPLKWVGFSAASIVIFMSGYVAGREHVKYELRTTVGYAASVIGEAFRGASASRQTPDTEPAELEVASLQPDEVCRLVGHRRDDQLRAQGRQTRMDQETCVATESQVPGVWIVRSRHRSSSGELGRSTTEEIYLTLTSGLEECANRWGYTAEGIEQIDQSTFEGQIDYRVAQAQMLDHADWRVTPGRANQCRQLTEAGALQAVMFPDEVVAQ